MKFISINCELSKGHKMMVNPEHISFFEEDGDNLLVTMRGVNRFTLCASCRKDFLKDLKVKDTKKLTKKEAKKVIKEQVDTNGNGRISKKEVENFLTKE